MARDSLNTWIGREMGNAFIGRIGELIAEKNVSGIIHDCNIPQLFRLSMCWGKAVLYSEKYDTGQVKKEKQISASPDSGDF